MASSSRNIYLCILIGVFTVIAHVYVLTGRNQDLSISKNTTEDAERSWQIPLVNVQDFEWNKNELQKCKLCSGKVPNYILQYGPGRTATTLQFHILCLCMMMLYEDEKKFLGCYNQKNISSSSKYTVIKTHNISEKFLTTVPSNSWIFMTSSGALSPKEKYKLNLSKRKIKEHNFTIPYVADVSLVSKRGHFIAYEYQSMFGLSNKKMQHIVEYIRYWDILRLCCGKQMSADLRNVLSPKQNYKPHHDPHRSTYPACEIYNISKVEQNLLNTYIFKKFKDIVSLRNFIGKPSLADGNLNGNYCERCNANIAKRHLKFNDKCA